MKYTGLLKAIRYLGFSGRRLFQIPVLLYHSVKLKTDLAQDKIQLESFRRQMVFLKENNYEVASLDELTQVKRQGKEPVAPLISITFDDGYVDNFETVFPILREFNFPAAIFVIAGKIGKEGFLNYRQLKEMIASGLITVGSHTMSHRYLLELDSSQQTYEIEDSKRVLEDNLGYKVEFFSYPWGGYSSYIEKIVEHAGYRAAFTTNTIIDEERSQRGSDLYGIKRLTMSGRDSFPQFFIKAAGLGTCFARRIKKGQE
ncbi:polysaccharide deacetylase family protein [bacterium]|nr:MAG: polysaccharide deacetylase family protein [bacterium]